MRSIWPTRPESINLNGIAIVLAAAICLCFSGCYTPPTNDRVRFQKSRPRFHESASADVVVRFYRWDSFFIVSPEFREDGFLCPLDESTLNGALDTLNVRRRTAVVVIVWTYHPEDMMQIAERWRNVLGKCGFNRIVCLSGNDKNNLDGMPIIDDWKQPVDEPKQNARF